VIETVDLVVVLGERPSLHRIREVMTPHPITVGPETEIRKLKALFDEHDFNAFPSWTSTASCAAW
jgi:hypothetical protein